MGARTDTDSNKNEDGHNEAARLAKLTSEGQNMTGIPVVIPYYEWDGYVEHFDEHTFLVRIVDIEDGSTVPREGAEFDREVLSEEDQGRLEEGTFVKWVVGLQRSPNDRPQMVSRIYLRPRPTVTAEDVEQALKKADEFLYGIHSDDSA